MKGSARLSYWVWLTAPLAWQAACKVNAGFALGGSGGQLL
jgi:hypothetical protein